MYKLNLKYWLLYEFRRSKTSGVTTVVAKHHGIIIGFDRSEIYQQCSF